MVAEFNNAFGHAVRTEPTLDSEDLDLRIDIFLEEVEEIESAVRAYRWSKEELDYAEDRADDDLARAGMREAKVEFLDALADTLVTLYGLAQATGMPITEAFDAVHKSNMSKLGEDGKPVYFTEGEKVGKIAKGPNYVTPTADLEALLRP